MTSVANDTGIKNRKIIKIYTKNVKSRLRIIKKKIYMNNYYF